jgi:hypothetical protein
MRQQIMTHKSVIQSKELPIKSQPTQQFFHFFLMKFVGPKVKDYVIDFHQKVSRNQSEKAFYHAPTIDNRDLQLNRTIN